MVQQWPARALGLAGPWTVFAQWVAGDPMGPYPVLPLRTCVWGIQNAQDHCLTRHWTRDMPLASPFKKYDGHARAYSSSASSYMRNSAFAASLSASAAAHLARSPGRRRAAHAAARCDRFIRPFGRRPKPFLRRLSLSPLSSRRAPTRGYRRRRCGAPAAARRAGRGRHRPLR